MSHTSADLALTISQWLRVCLPIWAGQLWSSEGSVKNSLTFNNSYGILHTIT